MRELLVLRHAKSARDTDAPSDFERPLSKRGRRDAPRVGRWLRAHGLVPDGVVSSPARRAVQTVRLVLEALDEEPPPVSWDRRIYEAGAEDLLAVVAGLADDCDRALLVGHNPGLEDLVHALVGDVARGPDGKLLTTAAIAHVRVPSWSEAADGGARLMGIVRPRDMDA